MLCNNPNSHTLLLFLLLLMITTLHQAKASSFIYAGCSPSKYDPNNPYQANLHSVLASIASSSSQASYNSFAAGNESSSTPGSAAYALYQCRNDLSIPACSQCVQNVLSQLGFVCTQSFSASLQLDGCFVRYSNDNFLGRLDTAQVYKICSSSTTDDGEFFSRRDDVLADLQSAVGFRVRSSGTVQGYTQCIGDLSNSDCRLCVMQAVENLKNACGSALAAEVYLSQCYARYWASGYYLRSSPSDNTDDDIGRTVAIIVGILAGLALFVVFISFLRKAC